MNRVLEAHLKLLSTLPSRVHYAKAPLERAEFSVGLKVKVNGQVYRSILAAAQATGHTQRTIVNMVSKGRAEYV